MNLFNQKKKKTWCAKRALWKQGQNLDFNLGGPKHEPKFFLMTWWFIKLKSMVDKKLHFLT